MASNRSLFNTVVTGKRCKSVAGLAAEAALWEFHNFDLHRLQIDLATAILDWNWDRGCFGHSLPLTTRNLSKSGATHYINLIKQVDEDLMVSADERLTQCPYFQWIFNSFQCNKFSFRILRRPPFSSYTLHADRDIGNKTFRFQIPLTSSPEARLLVTSASAREELMLPNPDFSRCEDWTSQGITPGKMMQWLNDMVRLNKDKVRLYRTAAGKLYYFPTQNYHNLFNFGSKDRYILTVDAESNNWLHERFPQLPQAI